MKARMILLGMFILAMAGLIRATLADATTKPAVSTTQFVGVTPILNVQNMAKSIAYYTNVLGFTKQWNYPDKNPHKTFASLKNGSCASD